MCVHAAAALIEAGQRMASERDPSKLLEILCHSARDIVGAKGAAVAILADDGQTVRQFVTSGVDAEFEASLLRRLTLEEPQAAALGERAPFLIQDYHDKLDDEGRSKLQTLRRLAQRMEVLLDSLLEFSRLGRVDLAIGDIDLNRVVGEVLGALQITLQEQTIAVRIPRRLPTIRCDRVRVGEVFRNLITNAIKYNDKAEKWIEVGFDRSGATPVFYVRDNGIGIRKQHFESVFRLFKRLHARDKFGGGTGIGLTIVKKIVERHGGRIWVESAVGEGSTFYFALTGDPS